MKVRTVFSTTDLAVARRAVDAARAAGVEDHDLAMIARSDIEMDSIPDKHFDAATDFVPAALRGAGTGGAMGLLAGLIAMAIPPIGLTVAGTALLTMAGVAVGGWASALAGSAVPDPVRRKFEAEIESGKILVVVDSAADQASAIRCAVSAVGGTVLPFDEPSVMVE